MYGEKPHHKDEEKLLDLAEEQADEAEDATEIDDSSTDPNKSLEQDEEPTTGTGLA
ncbi:hypothetical protein [Microbacterium flavum]|uniref:Uncharacterized protein n=1 Tax=Microbacterium flavum TaxID=415216 RepID=A0ABS5XU46_9MICO|nr:hypothetical protein [Microbacterium flavum]MBT8798062.1 hypothetical protein [Microbacterium flavum]